MGKAVFFWVMASVHHFSYSFRFASLQALGHTSQSLCICELGIVGNDLKILT